MVIGRLFFDKVLREVVVFCKIEKIFFLMKQGFFMGNGPSFLATIKPIKSIVWDHLGGTKTINLSHVFLLLCNDMVEETLLRPPKKSILDYGFLVMV